MVSSDYIEKWWKTHTSKSLTVCWIKKAEMRKSVKNLHNWCWSPVFHSTMWRFGLRPSSVNESSSTQLYITEWLHVHVMSVTYSIHHMTRFYTWKSKTVNEEVCGCYGVQVQGCLVGWSPWAYGRERPITFHVKYNLFCNLLILLSIISHYFVSEADQPTGSSMHLTK